MNENQISGIVEKVKARLSELSSERHVGLALLEKNYRLEDDWLYLVITPTRPGDRASDYADLMSTIKSELRKEDIENVLLVPAVED